MRAVRLSRREARDQTHARLIQSTLDLLRTGDVAQVTTGRIAQGAGLKQASFYAHFADRDECLAIAASMIAGTVLERLRTRSALLDRSDLRGSMRRIFVALFDAFLAEPEWARIFFRHRGDDTSPLGRTFREAIEQARAPIRQLLQLSGVRDGDASEAYVQLVLSGTFGLVEALLEGRLHDREVAIEAMTATTVGTLRALTER